MTLRFIFSSTAAHKMNLVSYCRVFSQAKKKKNREIVWTIFTDFYDFLQNLNFKRLYRNNVDNGF